MKQTNTDQTMIQKKCLHITINYYIKERWTTNEYELRKERHQKRKYEFIEEGAKMLFISVRGKT